MRISTILQVAADVADELSLNRPVTLFPNQSGTLGDQGDTTDRKLLRSLHKTVNHLATYDWQVIKAERVWSAISGEAQTGAIPTNFLRFVPKTMHDRSRRIQYDGPVSSEDWQNDKMWGSNGYLGRFRVVGDVLNVFPAAAASSQIAFEYITDAIGANGAGARINRFTADTDKALWDDELITLGIVAKFREMEGLEYAQAWSNFERKLQNRFAMDGHAKRISMADDRPSRAEDLRNRVLEVTNSVPGYSVGP